MYYKFNLKEESMSPATLKLDQKKKAKTEECSSTHRSYVVTITKIKWLFPWLEQAKDSINKRSISIQDLKVVDHEV